jgi:hypothetical protein
VSSGFM